MHFSYVLHRFKTLPSFKTRSVETMANWAIAQARMGDPWAGLGLAYTAHQRALALRDERGVMLALNASAICQSLRHDEMTALSAAVDAFNIAHRLNDESGMHHALTTVVGGAMSGDMFPNAADLLEVIIDRAMARNDVDLEIRARTCRTIVLGDKALFYEAEAEWMETMRLQQTHAADRFSTSRMLANHANLQKKRLLHHIQRQEHALADTAHERALSIAIEAMQVAEEEEHRPAEISLLAILGTIQRERGDVATAIETLRRAVPLSQQAHTQGQLPYVLTELAEAYRMAGDTALYGSTLETALNEANATRPSARIASICRKLAEHAQAEDRPQEQQDWLRRAEKERGEYEQACQQVRHTISELQRLLPAVVLTPSRAAG